MTNLTSKQQKSGALLKFDLSSFPGRRDQYYLSFGETRLRGSNLELKVFSLKHGILGWIDLRYLIWVQDPVDD